MGARFQNFARSIYRRYSRKQFFVAGALLTVLLTIPFHSVLAINIGGFAADTVNSILNTIFGTIAGLLNAIYKGVGALLTLSIGYFMSLPVNPHSENTPLFVSQGWAFMRNLVNALFVFLLAFLGLATALRWQNYQVQKTVPALVLLDITMPRLDGMGALNLIKLDPKTAHVPVLMCTDHSTLSDVEKCCGNGAAGYILKPFELTKVLEKVQSVLKEKKLE